MEWLFVIHADDQEHARGLVEAATDVQFVGRESSYFGGEYYASGSDESSEILHLMTNYVEDDGESFELRVPAVAQLLYVDLTDRGEYFLTALASIARLIPAEAGLN